MDGRAAARAEARCATVRLGRARTRHAEAAGRRAGRAQARRQARRQAHLGPLYDGSVVTGEGRCEVMGGVSSEVSARVGGGVGLSRAPVGGFVFVRERARVRRQSAAHARRGEVWRLFWGAVRLTPSPLVQNSETTVGGRGWRARAAGRWSGGVGSPVKRSAGRGRAGVGLWRHAGRRRRRGPAHFTVLLKRAGGPGRFAAYVPFRSISAK